MLKLSSEHNVLFSWVTHQTSECWGNHYCGMSVRVILFVHIRICVLPVKNGSNTCTVRTVPVDMQASGQ